MKEQVNDLKKVTDELKKMVFDIKGIKMNSEIFGNAVNEIKEMVIEMQSDFEDFGKNAYPDNVFDMIDSKLTSLTENLEDTVEQKFEKMRTNFFDDILVNMKHETFIDIFDQKFEVMKSNMEKIMQDYSKRSFDKHMVEHHQSQDIFELKVACDTEVWHDTFEDIENMRLNDGMNIKNLIMVKKPTFDHYVQFDADEL